MNLGYQRTLRIAEALIYNQVKYILYTPSTVIHALFMLSKDIKNIKRFIEQYR